MMRNPLVRLMMAGFGISAIGTLPLGTLNVAAMQISMAQGVLNAALYAIGAVLVEMIYVRISLIGINWIRHHARILKMLDWLTFLVVAALAVSSFIAAGKPPGEARNILIDNSIHPFFLGFLMSAVNPMQIPFWFGWSAVLFGKGVLQPSNQYYNWYIIGIGLGTMAGMTVFIVGGQFLMSKMDTHRTIINYSIAAIFGITALIFLGKILLNKGAANALRSKGLVVDDEPEA